MNKDELNRLNKAELIDKVLELSNTDTAKVAGENETLKKENATQKTTIEGLQKDNEALEQLNQKAMEKLAEAEKMVARLRLK